jgi:hypothetical protein
MDTWESFFREKSRRRAAAAWLRPILGWLLAALALLALVVGLLALVNA